MLIPVGTMQQHMKTMRLSHEWAIKREQYGKHPLISHLQSSLHDNKMSSIKSLIGAGKRLTNEEKEYLRKHDPGLYSQALAIEDEQRSFKSSLNRCKTKDEANWLYFTKIGQYADETRRTYSGTASCAEKTSHMQFIGARAAATQETYRNFRADGKYSRLPTEQELQDKKRLERERKIRDEQRKIDKKRREERARERIRRLKRQR